MFVKELRFADRLRATLGPRTCHPPQACNPSWHWPVTQADMEPRLVMAGNMSPSEVRGVNTHTCDVRVTAILKKPL